MKIFFLAVLIFLTAAEAKVHVFGDSHSYSSFGPPNEGSGLWSVESREGLISIPFAIHHLGAVTMHRVGRDGVSFLDVRNFDVEEFDTVVFVFGEIDVRCHIGKQAALSEVSEEGVLERLVRNYFSTIQDIRSLYRILDCIVFNVIPPTDNCFVSNFPYYGSLEDRVRITKNLNKKLSSACQKIGIKFLDVYNFYANSDGSLNLNLADGAVHIGNNHNYFVKNKLFKIVDLEIYR